jgi:chromosome segregation ATPase
MSAEIPAPRTAAAIQARQRRTEAILQRVRDAVSDLQRDHARITVRAVERRSGASRAFLYQNASARALIEEAQARAEGRRAHRHTQDAEAAEASWRERALNAEEGLKKATAEIQTQRRRIGELLGRIRDLELDLPADSIQRLVTENTTLKQRIQALSTENRTLTDRLAAARDNTRSLDKKIANLQAQLLDQHPGAAARHLRPVT